MGWGSWNNARGPESVLTPVLKAPVTIIPRPELGVHGVRGGGVCVGTDTRGSPGLLASQSQLVSFRFSASACLKTRAEDNRGSQRPSTSGLQAYVRLRAHSHTHFRDNLFLLINAHFRVQRWILSLWFHIKDFPSDLRGRLPFLRVPLNEAGYSQCPSILDSFQLGPPSPPFCPFSIKLSRSSSGTGHRFSSPTWHYHAYFRSVSGNSSPLHSHTAALVKF